MGFGRMKISNNILTATEGMVLTNGEIFGVKVRLGRCGKIEDWREITKEEYSKILKEQAENEPA